MPEKRKDFCTKCRKETEYELTKKTVIREIHDRDYAFLLTTAVCRECGSEMSIPGLIDENVLEFDKQYRAAEGIVAVSDIERLLKIYQIGKGPLSLALGFGEVTIPRYLEGQIPSKEYSKVMRSALTSPAFMKEKLSENRDKLTDTAYKKAFSAAENIESLFSVSEKLLKVIAYIFERLEEVTPLMLQKLLYFIQGIYLALRGEPLFDEDCRAWVHGPVYPEVYNMFKDFKYNPIDDPRFALLEGRGASLLDDERHIIDLVLNTFGMYGAKVLERITHREDPWKDARKGYADGIPGNELLPKESIMKYYRNVHKKYAIETEPGLHSYIDDILRETP